MNRRAYNYARGIGTISDHNGTHRTRGRKQVVKSSEPNVDAGKESKLPLNQNHLSCLFKWKVKLDSDAIPSTFLLSCSAANNMHAYIVDSLLGSMFTNGSGRTADVLYARGSPMHFAHKHAPAWTRKDHLQAYMGRFITKMFKV